MINTGGAVLCPLYPMAPTRLVRRAVRWFDVMGRLYAIWYIVAVVLWMAF